MIGLIKGNINDFEAVRMVLNKVEINETHIEGLLSILLQTNNILVANMIAFRLKKFNDSSILESIIEVISRPGSFTRRAKLIYCCDGYDCTKYLELFIRIVLEENGESCLNAIDIIGAMTGPFLEEQLLTEVSKIEAGILLNANEDKLPFLNILKKHLKELA